MRPGHNMKRSRGRGRHNKPQNNVSRTLESNGPDVKVRGTAQHIYEKYLQLARDANSAGDRVMAENYHQHAEHYYRLLLSFQGQMPAATPGTGPQPNGNNGRHHTNGAPASQGEFQGLPGTAFPGDEVEEADDGSEDEGQDARV